MSSFPNRITSFRFWTRLQYDTIYHEHLRYYSLTSLVRLLAMHELEVFHARPIPTHGGSIRVYAARKGNREVRSSVGSMLGAEPHGEAMRARLAKFRDEVVLSKLRLLALLRDLKEKGARICGISAPSRASTLVNYVGLDEGIIDYVCEIAGSLKIGKYMPGTLIPVVEESKLFADQPDCAIIFSWHIADELASKLREKGYSGTLITPLPVPRELVEMNAHAPPQDKQKEISFFDGHAASDFMTSLPTNPSTASLMHSFALADCLAVQGLLISAADRELLPIYWHAPVIQSLGSTSAASSSK